MYAYSDDTLIAGTGDTLHPIISTNIKMLKEVLNIKQLEHAWQINVNYEFINSDTARDVEIAFISNNQHRNWTGDIVYEGNIFNLQTIANGNRIESKKESIGDIDYFTYKVHFQKGINYIEHSYSLVGTTISDPFSQAISYKLTTGNNWQGPIGELHIEVVLPDNRFLLESNSFFKIEGVYKNGQVADDIKHAYTFLSSGKLVFKAKDFFVKEDIYIHTGMIPILSKEFIGNQQRIDLLSLLNNDFSEEDLETVSRSDIKLLRNSILAYHGYSFKDQSITQYFDKFGWYIPNEKASTILNEDELASIEILERFE
jgi:hypothetical protein